MVNATAEIAALVRRSLLKDCWYVSCGVAACSTFQLALGEKVARGAIIPNPAHSDDFRKFEGAANLLVWCSWRLDNEDGPLTSSDDTMEHVTSNLERLVGRSITAVTVDLPGWDLHLEFTGGYRLHVFCDHVPGDPSFDGNWQLSLTDKMIVIGSGSKCEIEARSP